MDARPVWTSAGIPPLGFDTLTRRVRDAFDQRLDDEVIETVAGGMRIGDYPPVRTLELVVHGHGLAAATDRPVRFPEDVVIATLDLLSRVGVARGQTAVLLRVLTGRGCLPAGFTVW